MVIRIANITRCTLVFAHNKEAVVSEKRNELEATVQLLSNQITRGRNDSGNGRYYAKGCDGARELASVNSALSRALIV